MNSNFNLKAEDLMKFEYLRVIEDLLIYVYKI